jgi:hypothetical protein
VAVWRLTIASYGVSLLVGALISSCVIYLLGSLWRPGVLLAGVLAVVLGVLRFLWPDRVALGGFKVPRDWAAWGIQWFLSAFGLMLGMGFVTTMPSPAMLALLVWMWHVHNFVFIVVTFEVFAIGRLLMTLVTLHEQMRSAGDVVAVADLLVDRMAYIPRVEAAVSAGLGLVLLIAGL